MEDTPCFECWLSKHFGLYLPVKLTSTLFYVEGVCGTTVGGTHNEISCVILETLDLGWSVFELEMPLLLLLFALLIGREGLKEILALFDLFVSICVDNLGEIFHQPEVCSHCIGETCELAQFWDEGDFVAGLTIFVDQKWLIWI